MLAPDQFASPMKSIVANFIVKDLLMNDRVCGGQTVYQLHIFFTAILEFLQQCHWHLFIFITTFNKY